MPNTEKIYFAGSEIAVWEEAIASVIERIFQQNNLTRDSIYLSRAALSVLARRFAALTNSRTDSTWSVESFREHLQEVIQSYVFHSCTEKGVQQIVAATTQIPPLLRPIQLLQRWLLGTQYFPNRFYWDFDAFVLAERDEPYTITPTTNLLVITINGVDQSFFLPIGENISAKQIIDYLNATMVGARAYPWGKRFAIETLDTTTNGSIRIKPESTADLVFLFDNTLRNNAPNDSNPGVLPFGWRLTGSYRPEPVEIATPPGTVSRPASFDAAMFGVGAAYIRGQKKEPFVGLFTPVYITNGGFESGLVEWDTSKGPEFYINVTAPYSGSRALGVITRTESHVSADGKTEIVGVKNTIRTSTNVAKPGDVVQFRAFHRAKTRGPVYSSPASPPTVFSWTSEKSVFGYIDQQFSSEPVFGDPEAYFVSLIDPSVDFIKKGVRAGMAVRISTPSYNFIGVIRGVSIHQLLLDWWRPGGSGNDSPKSPHIVEPCLAGSPVTYHTNRIVDTSKNFVALGVQTGANYKLRDRVRVDIRVVQQGQPIVTVQAVRDIAAITTTINPNDTLILDGGWGGSPTPISPTPTTVGNPYYVYLRPSNGSAYHIYHLLTDIPDFYETYKQLSAHFEYVLRFKSRVGEELWAERRSVRPTPSEEYSQISIEKQCPTGTRTIDVEISVEPEKQLTESFSVTAFNTIVQLARRNIVPNSETVFNTTRDARLIRGIPPNGHYIIDYAAGTIRFNSTGGLAINDTVTVTYEFQPIGGAEALIDDVDIRSTAERNATELHVAVNEKIQKIVFEDLRTQASGTLNYTTLPSDGATVRLGDDVYEFDYGQPDTGTINYSGIPQDGDRVVIDGVSYEFDDNNVVTPGYVRVAIVAPPVVTFTNLTNAINATHGTVTASINIMTSTITLTSKYQGPRTPPITLVQYVANLITPPFTISGPVLTGGIFPGDGITLGNIGVPVYSSEIVSAAYERLAEVVNQSSTTVTAAHNVATSQVVFYAISYGLPGNIIRFVSTGTGFTISPTIGYLDNGLDTRAGGWIFYTANPADGDFVNIDGTTFEFDSDNTQSIPGSILVPFSLTDPASVTWGTFVRIAEQLSNVTFYHDIFRSYVQITAVQPGLIGNTIVFSGTLSAATRRPSGGFLGFAAAMPFSNPDKPTCNEVVSFINSQAVGFTASNDGGRLRLTSLTPGYSSSLAAGTGTANTIFGFDDSVGVRHGPDATQPGWRITVGTVSPTNPRLVVVSNSVQVADKYYGSEWTARVWVRSSNTSARAHAVLFFDDGQGNVIPNLPDNFGSGIIVSSGTSVTGFGTLFLTELSVGDLILANNQLRQVTAISSNTALTVDTPFSPALSNVQFKYQKSTPLDPTLASIAIPEDNAVAVQTSARDFGPFNVISVRFIFFDITTGTIIDLVYPYLTAEIAKSLHVASDTIPRNKQREYKLYRMAVANPDVLTEPEAGMIGLNMQVVEEPIILDSLEFVDTKKNNIFPFSERVFQVGKKAFGNIYYGATNPTDGHVITIANLTYEFDNNSVVTSGNVPVVIDPSVQTTFDNLVSAINATSAYVRAIHYPSKKTVFIEALLAGTEGNSIVFSGTNFESIVLSPILGVLEGGRGSFEYSRGVDYIIRYDEGQIARLPGGRIPNPTPDDLVVSYSYFPGDVPLNENHPMTIKPVGVKLEPDLTCLFFFRGRMNDFTSPDATVVNFEPVQRTPDRFSHLRPVVRGFYSQKVVFTPSPPRQAILDYAAMVDQYAVLVKVVDGKATTIPQGPDGWFFVNDTTIQLSTSTVYLAPGETALYDSQAVYEFAYHVKFQYTSPPIQIADTSSPYVLHPYSYKNIRTIEEKVDAEQILLFNDKRRAVLSRPAIMDQGLAEMYRSVGGRTTVIEDSEWRFIDERTVEILLSSFDTAATYRFVYKAIKYVVE